MENPFLGNVVGREQLLNVQIAFPVVFQGLPKLPVPSSREVKGFDHAHSLKLLQHCVHQLCFRLLTFWRHLYRFLLHPGGNPQIENCPGKNQKADPPVKVEHAEHEDQGVDEAAQNADKYYWSGGFHYIQDGSGNSGDFPQAFLIKISHGNPLQLIADLNPAVCHHKISGVGLLELGKPVDHRPADDACGQQQESRPCGIRRLLPAG